MEELIDYLEKEKISKNAELEKFRNSELFSQASAFYKALHTNMQTMFGYPANHVLVSLTTQYLLLMHYTAPFSNNCGDIDERGNYAMDSKEAEKRIVNLFAEKFGMGDAPWGYVTSGGSESNSCGISLAFAKYPNGILYYSQAAHYSVEKYARLYKHVEIPSLGKDVLDKDALFAAILENYEKTGSPANLVLTHGTTQYGECDDVDGVVAFLRGHGIPYYLHVDAALFGGIPNNQTGAPTIMNAKERGIHSLCVSMHKYIGFPDVHSVVVATEKPCGEKIAYIGQHDTTVSGSRSIPAYALYNHVLEQLSETDTERYSRNIRIFEGLLKGNVPFYRAEKSNIFVVDAPKDEVCKRYQLSCFYETDERGNKSKKAHVIIFPNHSERAMRLLADSLKE